MCAFCSGLHVKGTSPVLTNHIKHITHGQNQTKCSGMRKSCDTCAGGYRSFQHDGLLCMLLCEYGPRERGDKYSKGLKGRRTEEEEEEGICMST